MVSGSGPAYVFLLAEAMEQAGEALGLDPAIATRLVQQTIAGAGTLLASSPQTKHRSNDCQPRSQQSAFHF